MEATFHAWAAEEYAAHLKKAAEGRQLLTTLRAVLDAPELQDYIGAIGRPAGGWTDGQVLAFGRVHALLEEDRIGLMRIPVGEPPDAGWAAAQAAVNRLETRFTALVHERTTDSGDGVLGWSPSISDQLPGGWVGSAPIALGSVDPSRTVLHLTDNGVVARWPSGSRDLWLFGFLTFTAWVEWREESFTFPLEDDLDPD